MEKYFHLTLGLGLLLIAVSYTEGQSPATSTNAPPPITTTPLPDLSACYLPIDVGPCDALFPRYHFEIRTGQCSLFSYGGCEGNANNFETLQECQDFGRKCLRSYPGGLKRRPVGILRRQPNRG